MKLSSMLTLLRNVQRKSFTKGDVIIPKGSSLRVLFYVRKGLVRSFCKPGATNEEEVTFQLFSENHIFGNIHTISLGEPSKFTYQALEPTVAYAIDYDAISKLTADNPDLLNLNRKFMGKRIMKQAFQRLESFVFLTPEERYQQYIRDYPNVVNRAPNKYIANILGITPTSLSRIRKRLSTKKE